MARTGVAVLCALLLFAAARSVAAQNLFEAQGLSRRERRPERDGTGSPQRADAERDPAPDRHATFTGWYVRPKFRFPEWRSLPIHVSLSLEYALFRQPGDMQFRQAVAVTPILERHTRTLEMSINPALEVEVKRTGHRRVAGLRAVRQGRVETDGHVLARRRIRRRNRLDQALRPVVRTAPHVIPAFDVRSESGWDLSVGVGRGLTGSSEHWVFKSIVDTDSAECRQAAERAAAQEGDWMTLRPWDRLRWSCLAGLVSCGLAGAVVRAQTPARGAAPTPAATASAAAPKVESNLLQLMRGIIYPASNVVFAAQDDLGKQPTPPDASTSPNPLTTTYGGWQAVENAALALAESANLIMMPGRMCSNGKPVPIRRADWIRDVQKLREAGREAYKAAQKKDKDAVVDVSGTISDACSACHDVYREKKGGVQDRCLP